MKHLVSKYTHDKANNTEGAINKFALNILRLASLPQDSECILRLEYSEEAHHVKSSMAELIVYVERDKDHYYFDDVKINNLDSAVEYYSAICAPLIKIMAVDETSEDSFEDLCLPFDTDQSDQESEQVDDVNTEPHVNIDDVLARSVDRTDKLSQASTSAIVQELYDEDNEIIEIYPKLS